MDFCSVAFVAVNAANLARTKTILDQIRFCKQEGQTLDNATFSAALTDTERSFFWAPTTEEMAEWNALWFNTPLPERHRMSRPQWDMGSMLDSLADGEYVLVGIEERDGSLHLLFDPQAYPFGGTGCMVAFLECFGHTIISVNDGTGRVPYVPRSIWKSKRS